VVAARAGSKSSARSAEQGGEEGRQRHTNPALDLRAKNGTQIHALQLQTNCN
jgi:hypothetical protein